MQNRKPLESVKQLLRKRGFAILAVVCAAAVGVTGYLYATQGSRENPTMSTGTAPQVTPKTAGEAETPPAQRNASPSVDASAIVPEVEENPIPTPAVFTIAMPVEGELTRAYSADRLSYDPTTRDWRTHAGIDILTGLGTEVKAAADGTVASITQDEALGTVVTIAHDRGYLTRYGNLDADALVTVGQTVARGEPIGYVGATALMEAGEADHLHFELCSNTVPLDPADYFSW